MKSDTAEKKECVLCGRICVMIQGKLESPLLAGSGEGKDTDLDVIVDFNGTPFLPGSSLAGALREYLRPDDRSKETDWLRLFGGRRKQDPRQNIPEEEERQSQLYVYDTELDHARVICRDGVRLDERKTASETAKYSMQAVETGAGYKMRLEIIERDSQSAPIPDEAELRRAQERDCRFLDGIITGLKSGELRIGAKSRRGFGRMSVEHVKIAKFNLKSKEDYRKWLEWSWEDGPFQEYEIEGLKGLETRRKEQCLRVPLRIKNTLLIRQYNDVSFGGEGIADSEQLCIQDRGEARAVIPGSSWAGAVRGRIAALVSLLSANKKWEEAQRRLEPFFGSWEPASERRKNLIASPVIFEESIINGGHSLPVTRNAVDRFTGGSVNGALFTEAVCVGGTLELVIRWPEGMAEREAVIGLILWAVSDLKEGMLAVGGETAVGRGILELNGVIRLDGAPVGDPTPYYQAAAAWCKRE